MPRLDPEFAASVQAEIDKLGRQSGLIVRYDIFAPWRVWDRGKWEDERHQRPVELLAGCCGGGPSTARRVRTVDGRRWGTRRVAAGERRAGVAPLAAAHGVEGGVTAALGGAELMAVTLDVERTWRVACDDLDCGRRTYMAAETPALAAKGARDKLGWVLEWNDDEQLRRVWCPTHGTRPAGG